MESGFRGVEVRAIARRAINAVGRAFFPHFCAKCGIEDKSLCGNCLAEISAPLRGFFFCPGCERETGGFRCGRARCAGSPLDGAAAMASYGNPVLRRLLHQYKYEGVAEAGESLGGVFGLYLARHHEALAAFLADATIAPVPLHYIRESMRGFNQSEFFAERLARAFGRPLSVRLLDRKFRWRHQADIAADGRRSVNVRGAIVWRGGACAGEKYVLVDDVHTTGATLTECARVLKSTGASRVVAVTVLRG